MIPPSISNTLLQVLFLFATTVAVAQGSTCNSAEPFCTGTGEVFPNTSGGGSAQSGPNYGCLFLSRTPPGSTCKSVMLEVSI